MNWKAKKTCIVPLCCYYMSSSHGDLDTCLRYYNPEYPPHRMWTLSPDPVLFFVKLVTPCNNQHPSSQVFRYIVTIDLHRQMAAEPVSTLNFTRTFFNSSFFVTIWLLEGRIHLSLCDIVKTDRIKKTVSVQNSVAISSQFFLGFFFFPLFWFLFWKWVIAIRKTATEAVFLRLLYIKM